MKNILAVERDLFFTSKLQSAVKHLPAEDGENWAIVFARKEAEFLELLAKGNIQVALVDTQASKFDWESLILAAHNAGIPALAFGSHVQPQPLKLARAAGAYTAVANSVIVDPEKLSELLRKRTVFPSRGKTEPD